ncbi:hypothetical protein AAF712_000409 [Marasmius tenuissimus]|uniref:Uncharacterized protein n=1 Tax=Marasmius tenuissimus TaxID=585030 RepID=A0ABR3AGX3_9AGAR
MLLPARPTPLPLDVMEAFVPRQNDRTETTEGTSTTPNTSRTVTSINSSSTGSSSSSSSSSSATSSSSSSSSSQSSSSESSTSSLTSTSTSSTPSSSATLTSSEGSSGLPTSALIGIIVGSAIGLILLLLLLSVIFTAWRRRRNDRLKRPSTSVVAGSMPSRSKRPETVYDIDSFLAPSMKQTPRTSSVAVPLLADESRPGTAYESSGVDEHGVAQRYTDNSRPGSPASTAPPTEFSHLASPHSADGHSGDGDGTDHYPRSLSMAFSSDPAFARLSMPPAEFSLNVAGNEQGNRISTESTADVPKIPPPPGNSDMRS